MYCRKCNEDKEITNKHFRLCFSCNNLRLENKKINSIKILRISHSVKTKNKTQIKINKDEDFYFKCFSLSTHMCEECGSPLPTEFRDNNNKVIARWRYSHILPKSIYPELRYEISNINHLCLIHHIQWDHGEKTSMNIYEINRKKFPNSLR